MTPVSIKNLRLKRTRHSTICEAISATMLLIAWIISILSQIHNKSNYTVPVVQSVLTLVVLMFHYISYRPTLSWPQQSFRLTSVRQAITAGKFYRYIAIEVAFLALFIVISRVTHISQKLPDFLVRMIFVGNILITYNIGSSKIRAIKKEEELEQEKKKAAK